MQFSLNVIIVLQLVLNGAFVWLFRNRDKSRPSAVDQTVDKFYHSDPDLHISIIFGCILQMKGDES